ncbi:MAG: hypothetical protein R6X33_18265 [Candidatus Brocadiia bacterium]
MPDRSENATRPSSTLRLLTVTVAGDASEEERDRMHVIRAKINPVADSTGGRVTITIVEPRKEPSILSLGFLASPFHAAYRWVVPSDTEQ